MAYFTMSVIMDFSEYENIEIFIKTQRFEEINKSNSKLQKLNTIMYPLRLFNLAEHFIIRSDRIIPIISINLHDILDYYEQY